MHTNGNGREPLTSDERLEVLEAKIKAYQKQQYDLELEGRIAHKIKNPEAEAQAMKTLKQLEEVLAELDVVHAELAGKTAQAA